MEFYIFHQKSEITLKIRPWGPHLGTRQKLQNMNPIQPRVQTYKFYQNPTTIRSPNLEFSFLKGLQFSPISSI